MASEIQIALHFDTSDMQEDYQNQVSRIDSVEENIEVFSLVGDLPQSLPSHHRDFRVIGDRLFAIDPRSSAEDQMFQHVTEQYQRGELTLGEAAQLLGKNRYEYDTRLRELGIVQEPEPRVQQDINAAQKLIRDIQEQ